MTKAALRQELNRHPISELFEFRRRKIYGVETDTLYWKAKRPAKDRSIVYITVEKDMSYDDDYVLSRCWTWPELLAQFRILHIPEHLARKMFHELGGELPSVWDVTDPMEYVPKRRRRRKVV